MRDIKLRQLMSIAVGTRLLVFAVALLAPMFLAHGPAFNQLHDNYFLNAWTQYDAAAYLDIANNGYNDNFMSIGNYQWWPLLPMFINFLAIIMHPVGAGFLVANLAFLGSVYYLYKLLKDDIGRDTAYNTVLYMMIYPTTYFFSAIYSESLYLFFTVAAIYYAKKSNWKWAWGMGALSALTRIFGLFIVIPLGYLYLKERGWTLRHWKWSNLNKEMWWALLIPLALLMFMGQMYALTGNPIMFVDHSGTSNRHMAMPFTLVYDEVVMWMDSNWFYRGYHTYNLFIYLSFVLAAILGFKVLPWEYALFLGYSVFIPTISTPIQGFTRYSLVMFPAFMVLYHYQKKEWVRKLTTLWLVGCLFLIMFFTTWHVMGGFA